MLAGVFVLHGGLHSDEEGLYAYAAHLCRQGLVPYRDFPFTAGVLFPVTYAWTDGDLVLGRCLSAVFGALTLISALSVSSHRGRWVTLATAVAIISNTYWIRWATVNKGYAGAMLCLTVAGFFAIRQTWNYSLALFFITLASQFRQSALACIPPAIALIAWLKRDSLKSAISATATSLLACTPLVAGILYLGPTAVHYNCYEHAVLLSDQTSTLSTILDRTLKDGINALIKYPLVPITFTLLFLNLSANHVFEILKQLLRGHGLILLMIIVPIAAAHTVPDNYLLGYGSITFPLQVVVLAGMIDSAGRLLEAAEQHTRAHLLRLAFLSLSLVSQLPLGVSHLDFFRHPSIEFFARMGHEVKSLAPPNGKLLCSRLEFALFSGLDAMLPHGQHTVAPPAYSEIEAAQLRLKTIDELVHIVSSCRADIIVCDDVLELIWRRGAWANFPDKKLSDLRQAFYGNYRRVVTRQYVSPALGGGRFSTSVWVPRSASQERPRPPQ